MTDQPTPRYFAASNSSIGFKNYYADCFGGGRTDYLYIIKGGPGTGKSHFMKSISRSAAIHGYRVTEYACSSDPASLDGLILEKPHAPTVGFVDGTAPHVWEPTAPGVREEIINLGEFWNRDILIESKAAIAEQSRGKSTAYARAYAALRAAGDMDAVADSLVDACVRREALTHLADRILRVVPDGSAFAPRPALRRALGMTGDACLHTFEHQASASGGRILVIDDYYGLGAYLTADLLAVSRERKLSPLVSYDPLYPSKVDGLYYPESGLCVLVGNAEAEDAGLIRSISLRRYADAAKLREVRGELRTVSGLRDRLVDQARHSLAVAARHHFELESIYTSAMDFPAKESFAARFCLDLFRS